MLMLYTISDFSREYEGSVRLIAGSDGGSRAVSGVGILDYELMPGLKNKYQRVNFSQTRSSSAPSSMRRTTHTSSLKP